MERRQATNEALINALAERANPSLSELSELVGLSQGRVSTRLTKLAAQGLTESPGCCPNRSWVLTAEGRKLAQRDPVVILDDTDRQFLTALALTPQRQMQLAAEVEVCNLTAKRRLNLLIERGMVEVDELRRFKITDKGREAVPEAPPPWVKIAAVSAANSRDVIRRLENPTEMPPSERSRLSSEIATRARKARNGRPREGKWAYSQPQRRAHSELSPL